MIKLGYFTLSNYKISETFIEDLLYDLNLDENFDLTYYYGSTTKVNEIPFKNFPLGFAEKYTVLTFRVAKFLTLFGKDFNYVKIKLKKIISVLLLKKQINKLKNLDVAYIDFATTAVYLYDFFDKLKIPFVVHVHGYDITSELNNKAYYNELQNIFLSAERFIAASHYMKRRLILLGCPESKINVVRYGVPVKNVEVFSWQSRLKNKPSIIFLGRLTPKKNPIALIYAFRKVVSEIPNSKLSIIGDGPLFKDVEKLVNKLNLKDNVDLYGSLDRKQSFPILMKQWVYAQHSVTPISGDTEGFAISLAEAALHEIPVVSTIHNGITENVIDGETGFLVPEYDYEAMAEKIIFLLKNHELMMKMGKEGRKNILINNDPKTRKDKIKKILLLIAKS